MKSIQCRELFPGCEFKAEGRTEEEVLSQAASHAATVHGLTELDDATVAKVRGCIRET